MLIEFKTTSGLVYLTPWQAMRVEVYTNAWDTPEGTHVARLFPNGSDKRKDSYELYRGDSVVDARKAAVAAAYACNNEFAREQATWHEECPKETEGKEAPDVAVR